MSGIDFDSVMDKVPAPDAPRGLTEAQAIDAIVIVQKANGDAIDPAGARRLVRSLIAIGVFNPASQTAGT